jgi:hypothetical protein
MRKMRRTIRVQFAWLFKNGHTIKPEQHPRGIILRPGARHRSQHGPPDLTLENRRPKPAAFLYGFRHEKPDMGL